MGSRLAIGWLNGLIVEVQMAENAGTWAKEAQRTKVDGSILTDH